MIKGVQNLEARGMRFQQEHLLTARARLAPFDYPDDESLAAFPRRLLVAWESQANVSELALLSAHPGRDIGRSSFALEGVHYASNDDLPTVQSRRVSPAFFSTFGVVSRNGRLLDERDTRDALPVVVVNTEFAAAFFPEESPIGRRVRTEPQMPGSPWRTIVGVVDDRGVSIQERETTPGAFLPLEQAPSRNLVAAVGRSENHEATGATLRAAVSSIDANLPLYDVMAMSTVLREANAPQRTFGLLFVAFGTAALLLATVGLYGALAFSVGRRTREIGLRRALGAPAIRVIAVVVKRALVQLAIGIGFGLALAAAVAPVLGTDGGVLFGTDPHDATVYLWVPVVLAFCGTLAAWIPSRRASRIHPMTALRYE
jgi:predicted permease